MRCKTCDYRLWNLKSRRCPECGTPFRPSEYEFARNSVQFCCPHCNQRYYGTGEKGHLVPDLFDCVSCGNRIEMDEMVLLPTEGLRERQTEVEHLPWLERRERGRLNAWFSMIGMAMVSPGRLMRMVPYESSVGQAFWFAFLTLSVALTAAVIPLALFPMVATFGFGGGAGGTFLLVGVVGFASVQIVLVLVAAGIWALVAHGMLRLTGRTTRGVGRTFQAICYSSGANAVTAVPFVGIYVGWIWWLVSAVLMVKEGQRVHGGRSAFAVLTAPVLTLLLGVAFMVWVASMARTAMTASRPFLSPTTISQTQVVLDGVLKYANENAGLAPKHPIQLVSQNYIAGRNLVVSDSLTGVEDVPIAGITLESFLLLPAERAGQVAQAAADALPAGTGVYRLGDFVFTCCGMDLSAPDPGLWLVVMCPDPDVNRPVSPATWIAIGQADGTVSMIPGKALPATLAAQNTLRSQQGLPPLADPRTVAHTRPAVSDE